MWLISTRYGSLKQLPEKLLKEENFNFPDYFNFPLDKNGKWFIYFDSDQKAYFSYEVATGIRRNITGTIPISLTDHEQRYLGEKDIRPCGVGGWIGDDSAILIYDDYDIWKVDPMAKTPPINITNGIGRSHHIRLRPLSIPGLQST